MTMVEEWDRKLHPGRGRGKVNGHRDPGPQEGDPGPQGASQRRNDPRYKGLVSVDTFMAGMRPPSYILDGIIQRGSLYSVTGNTSAGKTAICLLIASCIIRNTPLGVSRVRPGSVLFLAGENSENVRLQWYGLRADLGLQGEANLPLYFHDGAFSIEASIDKIRDEAAGIPNLTLIIADTLQSFFGGDDDNSNMQMVAAALSFRALTELPGNPTVLIPCHPAKNAGRDNMVPRGGSAFLNEVDGNLALWKDEDVTTLYSCGKHRGVPFEPLQFNLSRTEPAGLVDEDGRQMPSTVARPLLVVDAERAAEETRSREDRALAAIDSTPGISVRGLASTLGCASSAAGRLRTRLFDEKWIKKHGRHLVLTTEGKAVLEASQPSMRID